MTREDGRPPGDPPASAGGEEPASGLLGGGSGSLLDAVDSLLDRGALVTGDLVLGLADVDLIYLHLSTLLAAADRVMGRPSAQPGSPGGEPSEELGAGRDEPSAPAPEGHPGHRAQEERASPGAGGGSGTGVAPAPPGDPDALRHELERTLGEPSPPDGDGAASAPARRDDARTPRWNADPEDVERSVARLVLALVEFIRKLMERQAIRRMDEGTLTEDEVERLGQGLMRLEETVHDLAARFGIAPEDLNLDLGPLGTLS